MRWFWARKPKIKKPNKQNFRIRHIWVTMDNLGVIGFKTIELALQYNGRRPLRFESSKGQLGFLSVEEKGTKNNNRIKTPDGREIEIAYGYCKHGLLIGAKNSININPEFSKEWYFILERFKQENKT